MTLKNTPFDPTEYVAAMEYEYAGMINALNMLHQEAAAADLDLVSLHLKIAIAELKEYRRPRRADDDAPSPPAK